MRTALRGTPESAPQRLFRQPPTSPSDIVAATALVAATATLGTIGLTAILVLISLDPQQVSAAFTLAITVGLLLLAVIVLAAAATIAHRRFSSYSSPPPDTDFGHIFQGYVTRFSLFVGPVAGGYSLFKVIELFAKG